MKNPKVEVIEYAHKPNEIEVFLDDKLFHKYELEKCVTVWRCDELKMFSCHKPDFLFACAFDAGRKFVASKGGKTSKRKITPEQQAKMQAARRKPNDGSELPGARR